MKSISVMGVLPPTIYNVITLGTTGKGKGESWRECCFLFNIVHKCSIQISSKWYHRLINDKEVIC